MYPALQIADYIVARAIKNDYRVNAVFLNKIIYFLNVIKLIERGQQLTDDPFERWDFGPTNVEVFAEYSSQSNRIIRVVPHLKFDKTDDRITGIHEVKWDLIEDTDKRFIDTFTDFLVNLGFWKIIELSKEDPQFSKLNQNEVYDLHTSAEYWKLHQFWKEG